MASAVASLGLAPSDDASPAMMEEVEFVVASLVEAAAADAEGEGGEGAVVGAHAEVGAGEVEAVEEV